MAAVRLRPTRKEGIDQYPASVVPINGLNATLDGNGHTISNLHIHLSTDEPTFDWPGLIARTFEASIVRSIGLIDAQVEGPGRAGTLVGENFGVITDSYATGSVLGSGSGGLVGANYGTIDSSYSTVAMSGRGYVGGLAASNPGTIRASYSTGDVSGGRRVGGLAGHNSGTIIASHASGAVTGDIQVGGLSGENFGRILASYATGNATGQAQVGGLVGSNSNVIKATHASGTVTGGVQVGGLVGRNSRHGRWQPGSISASYATGPVVGTDSSVGGLVGENIVVGSASFSYIYWDTSTSGHTVEVGRGDPTGAVGKTTVELQTPTGYDEIYGSWSADWDNSDRDDDPTTGVDDVWDFGTSRQYPALYSDSGERPSSPIPMPSPTPTSAPTPASSPAPTVRPTLTHHTAAPVANESPRLTPQPEPVPTITVPLTPTRAPTLPSENAEGEGNGQAWLIALIIIATIVCITGAATYVYLQKR